MTELKVCWTCRYRELDIFLNPCRDCDELLKNKWEKRNDEKEKL